jgi:hypothetical protein
MICICLHKNSWITTYIWKYERISLCTQQQQIDKSGEDMQYISALNKSWMSGNMHENILPCRLSARETNHSWLFKPFM